MKKRTYPAHGEPGFLEAYWNDKEPLYHRQAGIMEYKIFEIEDDIRLRGYRGATHFVAWVGLTSGCRMGWLRGADDVFHFRMRNGGLPK